jgi:hypothetical protein
MVSVVIELLLLLGRWLIGLIGHPVEQRSASDIIETDTVMGWLKGELPQPK